MDRRRNIIVMDKVSKIYGEENHTIRALDEVSLRIKQGKIVTIMGPSGSGKSTLLNLLGAMDTPSSGSVKVNGIEISGLSERDLAGYRKDTVGFIFQNYYLLPNIDLIGNVLSPLIPYRIKDSDKQRAKELLTKVGLGNRLKTKVQKLSGGESQRVAIARSLINSPKILLADEPTGNLDTETGKAIVDLLFELAEDDKTIIIVTHDPRIAKEANEHKHGRNIWIKDGKLNTDPTYDMYCW